jgi:hypothetical protein
MPNVLTTAEDFCNAALGRIGYKLRIGSLQDGSEASKLCLDIYGQTRDQLLRLKDYDFAQKIAPAVLAPGAVPTPIWQFQYLYPTDCVRLRDMYSPTYDTNDPLPNLWTRDTAVIGGVMIEIILANISPAVLVYTEQVVEPSLWDEGFGETMIASLARRLSVSLADLNVAKLEAQDEATMIQATGDIVG